MSGCVMLLCKKELRCGKTGRGGKEVGRDGGRKDEKVSR